MRLLINQNHTSSSLKHLEYTHLPLKLKCSVLSLMYNCFKQLLQAYAVLAYSYQVFLTFDPYAIF